MDAKEKHKVKMIEYWGNPENNFVDRQTMYKDVLGITGPTFYHHFSVAELFDIEAEAATIRRDRSSRQRTIVLQALYEKAKSGDVGAVKEFLDRTEGKVPQKLNGSMDVNVKHEDIIDDLL